MAKAALDDIAPLAGFLVVTNVFLAIGLFDDAMVVVAAMQDSWTRRRRVELPSGERALDPPPLDS